MAGRPADLAAGREDRDRGAIDARADGRRQSLGVVQGLDVVPVELEADETPGRTAGSRFALERQAADEIPLVEADQPAEPDLAGE